MARTSPLSQVESTAALVAEEEQAEKGITRRRLLRDGGALVGAAVLAGRFAPLGRSAAAPSIAIVGGGLAGLTCAYRLRQAGVAATLYEGSNRLGGRCWTGRGDFLDGQIYEHGGELIDSGHFELKHLVQELGFSSTTSFRPRQTAPTCSATSTGSPTPQSR